MSLKLIKKMTHKIVISLIPKFVECYKAGKEDNVNGNFNSELFEKQFRQEIEEQLEKGGLF